MSKIVMPYGTTELVRLYQYHNCGHYFDKDTMRFFRSRITCNFRRLSDSQALFITTEQGPAADSPRRASLRLATLKHEKRQSDGHPIIRIEIETVGGFNSMTLARAKTAMKNYGAAS